MRKHGSLTSDAETNEAAWEAARGAGVGAAKVSAFSNVICFCKSFWLVGRWKEMGYGAVRGLSGSQHRILIGARGLKSCVSGIGHYVWIYRACSCFRKNEGMC